MAFLVEAQRSLLLGLKRLSPTTLRALAGSPSCSPEGFTLDPDMQIIVRMSEMLGHSKWSRVAAQKARRMMEASSGILQPRPTEPLSIHDEVIRVGRSAQSVSEDGPMTFEGFASKLSPGIIRARVYRDPNANGPVPVIVFYHGGGFVIGSLLSHDGECRALALETGAMVISVDYRLAPEHQFPTAVDDATAAFLWAAENARAMGGDPSRMAVAGDSAGGNISAVVAHDLKDHPQRPIFQCLIYPATDFTRQMPSHQYFREGYFLSGESMDWFLASYVPEGMDLKHPRVSPLYAESHKDLPPAFIATAGFDPLRDEGRAYADTLTAAGVPVVYRCYEGLVHGFFNMTTGIAQAAQAFDDIAASLREALHAPR